MRFGKIPQLVRTETVLVELTVFFLIANHDGASIYLDYLTLNSEVLNHYVVAVS